MKRLILIFTICVFALGWTGCSPALKSEQKSSTHEASANSNAPAPQPSASENTGSSANSNSFGKTESDRTDDGKTEADKTKPKK